MHGPSICSAVIETSAKPASDPYQRATLCATPPAGMDVMVRYHERGIHALCHAGHRIGKVLLWFFTLPAPVTDCEEVQRVGEHLEC